MGLDSPGFVSNKSSMPNGRLLQFALKLKVLDYVNISDKTAQVILKENVIIIIINIY